MVQKMNEKNEGLEYINKFREESNLPRLEWNEALENLALEHCRNMAQHKVRFGTEGMENRSSRAPFVCVQYYEQVKKLSGFANPVKQAIETWTNIKGKGSPLKNDLTHFAVASYKESGESYVMIILAKELKKVPGHYSKEALDLTNKFRAENGKPPLQWSNRLAKLCAEHSKNMASGATAYGHNGFEDRARRVSFAAAFAENVAYTLGFEDCVPCVVKLWINSPGHRRNMLGDFTHCAVAYKQGEDGKIYFTQLFAKQ